MNTKLLMILSALFMAALGLAASFLPQEVVVHFGCRPDSHLVLLVQITGALYLGFAILNWTAQSILIGGIYARPVALGNFLHFAVVAITLLKALAGGFHPTEIVAAAALYSLFAACFGLVLFTTPRPSK
jgi:Fe2+ transport system protein B